MKIILNLSSSEFDNKDLRFSTQRLCNRIINVDDIHAEIISNATEIEEGAKGKKTREGVILLALVTGSAITALCGVIETYITDNPSVTVKIEHSNGSKILINVDNIKELEKIKPILLEAQKLAP
jgi:hypothetical protein